MMTCSYVLYIFMCILNAVMAVKVADLHLYDWQYWVWILIPGIVFGCGVDIGERR